MAITDEIPKSRLTLTYRTDVQGERETIALPLRLLLMGDFSVGCSKDCDEDLDTRAVRNLDGTNLNQVMADMEMCVEFKVPDTISPRGGDADIRVPIRSMKSFDPGEVAKHVPKIRSLLLLKELLLEVQSHIDNRKEFRRLLREMSESKDAVKAVRGELKGYTSFSVPEGSSKPDDS